MVELYIPREILIYLKKCQNLFLEAVLLVGATGILCFVLFYVFGMMWHLYLETPMGQKYVTIFHDQAGTIEALLSADHLTFSCWLTLATFLICLGIAAICRFLHISRYLYCSQGICGKLLFWVLPLSAAVAFFIRAQYHLDDTGITFLVALIPTLCLFAGAFRYTQQLLPEFGDVVRHSFPFSKWVWRKLGESFLYLVELWGRL